MQHKTFDLAEFRVALARRGTTRVRLAAKLGIPYTTAVGWWTGRHPAPAGFRQRVEEELGLNAGALLPKT